MNNRQLKFRIWSEEYSKMFFSDSCPLSQHWISADKQELVSCPNYIAIETFGMLCVSYRLKPEEYKNVMQFTGLLDKNNKEIYEGDIIKQTMEKSPHCRYIDFKIPDNQKTIIREVKWDNYSDGEYVEKIECYMFNGNSLSELISRTKSNYQEYIYAYEVIGNIFENQNLL